MPRREASHRVRRIAGPNSSAVLDCASRGITFGSGVDFTTNLANNAVVTLGHTYACRTGSGSACSTDLAGSSSPALVDLEVYVTQ